MKLIFPFIILFFFSGCSTLPTNERIPAEAPIGTCAELVKSIMMTEDYDVKLSKALVDKKLLTFKEKKIQLEYPHLEWINRVKKSFNQSLRNWNNNRYPAFYLFNDEEIVPIAKRYSQNLEKILGNQIATEDDETIKAFISVSDWTKAFANYQTEMDQLVEERISLQYNISLLKKLKLDSNESRDIQISIKRGGVLQNEVITLRKEDKNLGFTINKLKSEMKDLDGSLIKNGKIKDRILRQAMLQDMLTIVQRELEYITKNTATPSDEVLKEFATLTELLKKSEYSPSTYGVYKIEDKIFMRELLATSKLDVLYTKIKEPLLKLKTVAVNFFTNKSAGTDKEKIGFFKKVYAKITSITPTQAAIGGGSLAVAGYGIDRYFGFHDAQIKEIDKQPIGNQLTPDDLAHKQQLERTQKVETDKNNGHSEVVEIHIDELTN